MGSTRRKVSNASKLTAITDVSSVDRLVQRHIEERNYLMFSICNNDLIQIKELTTWSVEGFYQILLMNHLKVKKEEAAAKTAKEKSKMKVKK